MLKRLKSFNGRLAIRGTLIFGTMWTCYTFMLYGFLAKCKSFIRVTGLTQNDLLYWSNWVQLWALPLILVGSNLLARATERMFRNIYCKVCEMYEWVRLRDQETHDAVMTELQTLKESHNSLHTLMIEASTSRDKLDELTKVIKTLSLNIKREQRHF